jgi:DNA-directed RNA polymerase subunit RPC12/RpoP
MGKFSHTYTIGPPNRLDRIACRRRYTDLPWGTTHARLMTVLVLLFPVSWRWLNRVYADVSGFFWLPCVRCGREFGGHEAGRGIPDPKRGVGASTSVCRYCSHEMQTMLGGDA